MKKITLLFVLSASVFATNGGLLTGTSPASQAMGGTGTSTWMSVSDAFYKNPANLSLAPGNTGSGGIELNGTLFKQIGAANAGGGERNSKNGAEVIPALGAHYKATDDLSLGFVAMAYGGTAADYSGDALVSYVNATAMYSRVGVGAAYKVLPNLSIGFSPYLTYSKLRLNAAIPAGGPEAQGATAFGANFGANFAATKDLNIGVGYTLKNTYTYKGVLDLDALNGAADGVADNIESGDPAVLNTGISYKMDNLRFAFDYSLIFFKNSEGQGTLGWADQSVFALGAEYNMNEWDFRLGFNYAKDPIGSISGEAGGNNSTQIGGKPVFKSNLSLMNMAAFPGMTETHFSAGVGYKVAANFRTDAAFVYSPEKSATRAGTNALSTAYSYTGKVKQWAMAVGLSYLF